MKKTTDSDQNIATASSEVEPITINDLEITEAISTKDITQGHPARAVAEEGKLSYLQAVKLFARETWPFFATRAIEVGTDFAGMAMLADIGYDELSATSLIGSCVVILRSVNATFLYYTGVKTTLASAAGNIQSSGNILKASWLLATGLSVPAIALACSSAEILKMLKQPETVAHITQSYLRAFSVGIPLTLMSISNQQFMLGLKHPLLVLAITIATRPISLGVCYLSLHETFGLPNLGVASLGYGNSISFALNFAVSLAFLLRAKMFKDCQIIGGSRAAIMADFRGLFKKGAAIAAFSAIELGTVFFSTILIGQLGVTALAAMQPAQQYGSLLGNMTYTFSTSAGILIGHELTKKQFSNVIKLSNVSNAVNLLLPLTVLLAFFAFSKDFISPFISQEDAYDDNIYTAAYIMLMISLIGQVAGGLQNSGSGILRGHKDTLSPMLIKIFTLLIINIPLACVSGLVLKNAEGIVSVRSLSMGISALLLFIRQMKISYGAEKQADAVPEINQIAGRQCWQFFKRKLFRAPENQPLLINIAENTTPALPASRWPSCSII